MAPVVVEAAGGTRETIRPPTPFGSSGVRGSQSHGEQPCIDSPPILIILIATAFWLSTPVGYALCQVLRARQSSMTL